MQASMEISNEIERFYLNLSNHKVQDGFLWSNIVLSPSPISPKVVFAGIYVKLLERLKSHDQSYTTRILAPSLFANHSSRKRMHISASLSYT